ncbi:MAG: N-acetyltransferase family protein [Sphingomicrobium sp.]
MARLIRLAVADDAAAIAAIYRPYVEDSWISLEEQAPDAVEMARRLSGPLHPWLVVEEDGAIAGYASTSPMRPRAGYRWSVETGVYVAQAMHGQGLGRALLETHLALLERQGFVTAIAGISLPNDASVALHETLGFALSGIERGVGFKHSQWIDVGRWQRDLASRGSSAREPRPFASVGPPE